MRILPMCLGIFISTTSFNHVIAGQGVGDGGDPLDLIFVKARVDAVLLMERLNLKDETAERFVKPDVLRFLTRPADRDGGTIANKMIEDIRTSKHDYFDEAESPEKRQSTCARTNIPEIGLTTIRISRSKCRELLLKFNEQDLALKVLIHESVHHFNVGSSPDEERFAWDVADQVYRLWQHRRMLQTIHWQSVGLNSPLSPRSQFASAEGNMETQFIWGGCNNSSLPNQESCKNFLNDGAVVSLQNDKLIWKRLPEVNAPSGRKLAAAVNISEDNYLVWGGCNGETSACSVYPTDAGLYDSGRNTWQIIGGHDQLRGRVRHTMVSIGNRALIYGGIGKGRDVYGDLWVLSSDLDGSWQWRQIDLPSSIPARYGHSATFIDGKVLIWGGCAERGILKCRETLNEGFTFDPETEEVTPVYTPTVAGRMYHSATVAGDKVIVWGGTDGRSPYADGVIFGHLSETPTGELLEGLLPKGESTGRYLHRATWTGHSLLVFGGELGSSKFSQKLLELRFLRQRPSQQSWREVETDTSPIARKEHLQVMMGGKLFIWGGFGANQTYLPTGALLYNLKADGD